MPRSFLRGINVLRKLFKHPVMTIRFGAPFLFRGRQFLIASTALFLANGFAWPETGFNDSVREITILHTNDFESAFNPIPAYWRDDVNFLGGGAELASLVEEIRTREDLVYLFDAGDMFTGLLSNRTQGEVLMEMMITMRYDAMAIGNHEYDYGWENLRKQKNRVPFPVLGANIFYKGTDIPYAQPYAIVEKERFRIGVIGIIGEDARSVVLPSFVAELEFRDPPPIVREAVAYLKPDVDLVVVLAHMGMTAPMQTDASAHPEIQRGVEADLALVGAVPGIDIFIGGHADHGTEEPIVHPETGTLVVQTYGHGTRLGYIKLKYDTAAKKIVSYDGKLLLVESEKLVPHPIVARKIEYYRKQYPEIEAVVGHLQERLIRSYNTESSLGSFAADVMRESAKSDVAFINAGGLRADLPEGEVTYGNVIDAFPFPNRVVLMDLSGKDILGVLEQSMTLERGMIQASGLIAHYDLDRPKGQRVTDLEIGGKPVDPEQIYKVAVADLLAEGADLYSSFLNGTITRKRGDSPKISEVILQYFSDVPAPDFPKPGRLIPTKESH